MMHPSRVTAGTPAAADDLERSVALMAKIGASWSPRFSPDGTRLVFVSNLNGSPQVWTMPSTGGFPRVVTAFDDPVGFVTWSPDGQWLTFNVAPGGGLNEQIYLARPDGSELRRLTEGGTENNFLGGWTPDGRYIFFSSNRRRGASTDSTCSTWPVGRCGWWPSIVASEGSGMSAAMGNLPWSVVSSIGAITTSTSSA